MFELNEVEHRRLLRTRTLMHLMHKLGVAGPLLLLVLLLGPNPAKAEEARRWVDVGICDSEATTFTVHGGNYWRALHIKDIRAVVRWDVALSVDPHPSRRREMPSPERWCSDREPILPPEPGLRDALYRRWVSDKRKFDAWYDAAEAMDREAGRAVRLKVSFRDIFPYRQSPEHPAQYARYAPPVNLYGDGFSAFLNVYPKVKILGAWNEPNYNKAKKRPPGYQRDWARDRVQLVYNNLNETAAHPRQYLDTWHHGAARAAAYFEKAARILGNRRDYKLVAGEFTGNDSSNDQRYWEKYLNALPRVIRQDHKIWSVHPYDDVDDFRKANDHHAKGTMAFLRFVHRHVERGEVWLTAVGAKSGPGQRPHDAAVRYILTGLAKRHVGNTHVTRLYYYEFMDDEDKDQDRGLIEDGRPGHPARQAYEVFRDLVRRHDGRVRAN